MNKINQIRLSNFELLRILAMIFVIAHHFARYGFYQFAEAGIATPLNNAFSAILYTFGKLGVAIFVMITGYFMIDSSAKLKNGLKLYLTTFGYSILFLGLAKGFFPEVITPYYTKMALTPIISQEYWFINAYLLLFICIPLINKGLEYVKNRNWETPLFCVFTLFYLFIHTNLTNFIYLYILGGYLKRKVFPLNKLNLKFSIILATVLITILVSYSLIFVYPADISLAQKLVGKFSKVHSPYTLLFAIALFNCFSHIKLKTNHIINKMAQSVFAVYLIHENPLFKNLLWEKVFCALNLPPNYSFIPLAIVTILIIFIVFALVDQVLGVVYKPIQDYIIGILYKIKEIKLNKKEL